MSATDYLNLGGDGGAMVQRIPARALNSAFVPSAGRPVIVVANLTITTGAAAAGRVEIVDNTSSLILGTVSAGVGAAGAVAGLQLIALVQPGHSITLATTITAGAPVFAIVSVTEYVL